MSEKEKNDTDLKNTEQPEKESVKKEKVEKPKNMVFFPREGVTREI